MKSEIQAIVSKNSNRVIGSTSINWGSIRPGSFVKFGYDEVFYNIFKTNKLSYVKEFETLTQKELKIKGDPTGYLFVGDKITISFKQFELATVISIPKSGKGYIIGETVYVNEGAPLRDHRNNIVHRAEFKVEQVDDFGGITQLTRISGGLYVKCPTTTVELIGENGSGAVIEAEFRLLDHRCFIERNVEFVSAKDGEGFIKVDYFTPYGLSSGIVTIEKYEMILTGPYLGESSHIYDVEIHRDFTPHLELPLLANNSRSMALLYNKALMRLDVEINALKARLNAIETSDRANRRDASPA